MIDFDSFLNLLRTQGIESTRERVETWNREGQIDITQYTLMMSHLARKAGSLQESTHIIQQSLREGGEVSPLNISLAEDFLAQGKYAEAIKCCNNVIRDDNDLVASRFLSSAFLMKAYALSKIGEYETAETILRFLRSDLLTCIDGKFQTPQSMLAQFRKPE